MTISIRISQSDPHRGVPQGGLIAAFAGGTQYVPGGSTDVEITSDEIVTRKDMRAFLATAAPLAADTFRTAALGERVLVDEVEFVGQDDPGVPQVGADDLGEVE